MAKSLDNCESEIAAIKAVWSDLLDKRDNKLSQYALLCEAPGSHAMNRRGEIDVRGSLITKAMSSLDEALEHLYHADGKD